MNNNINPTLVKACAVIRLLSSHSEGMSQSEIEEKVQLTKATAFRVLTTLCQEDFVTKHGKLYYIGAALAQIGLSSFSQQSLIEAAKPVLYDLANKSGETSHLAVLSGQHSLILDVCNSPNPYHVASRPGSLADLHCSSTGKIFLAWKEGKSLKVLLSRLKMNRRTDHTHKSIASLKKDLQHIRKRGFALDDREYYDNIRCLAVPVKDKLETVIAAIGITAGASIFTRKRDLEMALMVQNAAKDLEIRLAK